MSYDSTKAYEVKHGIDVGKEGVSKSPLVSSRLLSSRLLFCHLGVSEEACGVVCVCVCVCARACVCVCECVCVFVHRPRCKRGSQLCRRASNSGFLMNTRTRKVCHRRLHTQVTHIIYDTELERVTQDL